MGIRPEILGALNNALLYAKIRDITINCIRTKSNPENRIELLIRTLQFWGSKSGTEVRGFCDTKLQHEELAQVLEFDNISDDLRSDIIATRRGENPVRTSLDVFKQLFQNGQEIHQ